MIRPSRLLPMALLLSVLWGLGFLNPAFAQTSPKPTGAKSAHEIGANLAGTASRALTGPDAFRFPPAGITPDQLERFFAGQRLFNLAWVKAPSPITESDGLGPTFNRVSCGRCHVGNGRGRPPRAGEPFLTILLRLAKRKSGAHGAPQPHPAYGLQLQDRSIPGVFPEGRAEVRWIETSGRYGDGTTYSLIKPVLKVKDLRFGPLGAETRLSLRTAPHLIGLGLLEAVPEKSILSRVDVKDRNGDGISGRANLVPDRNTGRRRLGRFGWKAGQPDIRHQVAAALSLDMGLTTNIFPKANCPRAQKACAASPHGGNPEVTDRQLDLLTFYSGSLAVPRRRRINTPMVQLGALLFGKIGCAACHTPTLRTGKHPTLPALSNQRVHAFTDLLLHDMGPGLADDYPEYTASGREWRTPPLWGIGLIHTVNRHNRYLHDGRARSLAEAILWHGGEAQKSREEFRNLPLKARQALVAFLRSL